MNEEFYQIKKKYELLMIFFFNCIGIKVTEQIVNPLTVDEQLC